MGDNGVNVMGSRAARLLAPGPVLAMLLAAAFLLRFSAFGHPNLNGDEAYYHAVGIAMHEGALPYVDLWDRKPFGLFALYWLITFFGSAPAVYQVAATLFAAATAAMITAMARPFAGGLGALLAGLLYLLWLGPLEGYGGQSPVLYNAFMAGAALLVWRALPRLRHGTAPSSVALAMLLAGMAITIKTTALFEAVFLGLYACAVLLRARGAGGWRVVAAWALTGAAPTVAIAAGYALGGHWHEYWHAMVTANLAKPPMLGTSLYNARSLAVMLSPVLLAATIGFWLVWRRAEGDRMFLAGWIAAALVGLFSVPNFFFHYAMPLLVPLCVAAAGLLARDLVGIALLALLAVLSAMVSPPIKPGRAARSLTAMEMLERAVQEHVVGGPMFVYHGPPQLYWRTGNKPPTPLVFPTHLSQALERNVSHLDTLAETRRVLALRPGAVVISETIQPGPPNRETLLLVHAYIHRNCRKVAVVGVPDWRYSSNVEVWGDCAAPPASSGGDKYPARR